MAALTHRTRLLVAALEAGELDFALRVARQHADDLRALLAPAPAQGSPNHLPDLEEPERVVTTAGTALDGDARPPRFTIAVAGSFEGTTYVGVSIDAATLDDEQRLW